MRWWRRLGIFAAIGSLAGVLCAAAATSASADQPDMYDGHWRFTIAPYVWIPSVSGTFNFTTGSGAGVIGVTPPAGTTVSVFVPSSSLLANLNWAASGYLEARKGNWSVFTDIITLSLSAQGSKVATFNVGLGPINISPSFDIGTTSSLSTTLASLAGSYTVIHRNGSNLDVFAGAQLASASASVTWSLSGPLGLFPQSGSASRSQEVVAGIAGIKGNLQLGNTRWFMPYYADVGAGGFSTYQALAGIGYAFSWGNVELTYRILYLDMGSGNLLQNITMNGPMLAAAFNF